MSQRYACSDPDERNIGTLNAARAVERGDLVVFPTDTVYGVGTDAFDPDAVAGLVAAKERGRAKPPPVLIGNVHALDGVATGIPSAGRALVEEFWPGGLTLVCREQPSLVWDLGEAKGTVAIRMPDHPIALGLLEETGPMAVTSANITGNEPTMDADGAYDQLGERVTVYLDGGKAPGGTPSTIVDLTASVPRLLRSGAITLERLREVVPELEDLP